MVSLKLQFSHIWVAYAVRRELKYDEGSILGFP